MVVERAVEGSLVITSGMLVMLVFENVVWTDLKHDLHLLNHDLEKFHEFV